MSSISIEGLRGPAKRIDILYPSIQQDGWSHVNDHPNVMWDRWLDEEAIIGKLAPVRLPTGELLWWYATYPQRQYIPGGPEGGTHFMLTPRLSHDEARPGSVPDTARFLDVGDLPPEALMPPAEALRTFLLNEQLGSRHVVGVNFSADQKNKPSSRSWKNLHFHGVEVPETVLKEAPTEQIVYEPHAALMRNATTNHFLAHDPLVQEGVLTPLLPQERDTVDLALRPETVPFRLQGVPDTQTLANTFRSIDTSYRRLHETAYRLFTENFDAVKESHWSEPYLLRPEEEVDNLLRLPAAQAVFQGQETDVLSFYRRLERGYEKYMNASPDEGKKIMPHLFYRSPTYSLTLVKQKEDLYALLCPHLVSSKGSMETAGFELHREVVQDMKTEPQKRQTREVVKRLFSGGNSFVLFPPRNEYPPPPTA